MQFAAPEIFAQGGPFLAEYRNWILKCRTAAVDGLQGLSFVPPRGGFYITLRVNRDEEQLASTLLERDGILVHPGYFYDILPDHLVMTFIDDPDHVRERFERIGRHVR
jgi:aspartate/methionine/tyrosine aminotransferase